MPFLYVIAALIVLVVLHELGHFLAARWTGIRATKFYIFFPPALYKRTIGGVEYGVGAIPAGGFVKLPGMFEPVASETADRLRWSLERITPYVASADQSLELDPLVRRLERAASPEQIEQTLVEIDAVLARIGDSSPVAASDEQPAPTPREWNKRLTRTRKHVASVIDDCHPQAYWRAQLWRRMVVIAAGPFVNIVVALVLLTAYHALFVPQYEITTPFRLDKVTAGSPAAEAGLDTKSDIVGWNGPVVGSSPREVERNISKGLGKPVTVTWVTVDDERITKIIEPRELKDGEDPRIGVLLPRPGSSNSIEVEVVGYERPGITSGTTDAAREMRAITWGNLTGLSRVVFDSEAREQVGSVVGIVQVADEVSRAGQMLRYVGIISLILAVMNLLPLLPLDGGHLLFGFLEAIRKGRPMPKVAFERYSALGLGLVLVLFVIGLNNDLGRAFGG